MSKTTKILLPVDFSEPSANAFRYTLKLANQIGASIEILNVVFPEGESMDYPILVAKATETRLEIARDRLNKFIKKELSGMREVLQKEPVLSTNLEIGTPVQCICSVAKRNDMSLIILGSRGENRSGIESLIGSVAAGVVSKCQCPVIVIPESAELVGTLRTLDTDMQSHIHKRMREMVADIAKAYRAEATIDIDEGYPITYNDPTLTSQMVPSLEKAAGKDNVIVMKAITGAEDFSFFQQKIPGLYFFLGGMTKGNTEPFPHHTPDFFIDESGMLLGVKAFIQLSLDYLND